MSQPCRIAFEAFSGQDRKIPDIVSDSSTQNLSLAGKAMGDLTTSQFYPVSHYKNGKGAHGFMHERCNHFRDFIRGRWSRVIGGDNKKNGADRVVDGVFIQDKAHKQVLDTIKSLFENRDFCYKNADGSPMLIEVPSDQVKNLKNKLIDKIVQNKCTGIQVSDVESCVIAGSYTYDDVIEMCKAGTYAGFVYDISTGLIPACSLGILAFWTDIVPEVGMTPTKELPWNSAIGSFCKETSKMMITHVVKSQLDRTSAPEILESCRKFLSQEEFFSSLKQGGKSLAIVEVNHATSGAITGPRCSLGNEVAWMGYVTFKAVEVAKGDISCEEFGEAMTKFTVAARCGIFGMKAGTFIANVIPGVGPVLSTALSITMSLFASYVAGDLVEQFYAAAKWSSQQKKEGSKREDD